MKTGKKVLGAVLAAAMALSSITPVFAADKVKITFMSRDSGDTPMAKVYEDQIAAFMESAFPDLFPQSFRLLYFVPWQKPQREMEGILRSFRYLYQLPESVSAHSLSCHSQAL